MNRKRLIKYLLVTFAISLMQTACNEKQNEASQSGSTNAAKPIIKLAQCKWLGNQLNNAIASILLTEEMGYRVEIIDIDPFLATNETYFWDTSSQRYLLLDSFACEGAKV